MPTVSAKGSSSAGGGPQASGQILGAAFRPRVGQTVEVDVFGTRMTAKVLRSGEASLEVDGPRCSEWRRLRLGVHATVTLGADGGAARADATLGPAREGICLQLRGPFRLVNRRADPRAAIIMPVDVAWMPPNCSQAVVSTATTLDLSAGGVRLTIDPGCEVPTESTMILLGLRFPDRRLTVPGLILAVAEPIVRARFCGPPHSEDVAAIAAVVLQSLLPTGTSSMGRAPTSGTLARGCR
jgi:hypothetical protein